MIRLIAAALISAVILGGLTLFLNRRDLRAEAGAPREVQRAAGTFSMDVTLSFSPASEDPFALVTDDAEKKPSVIVQLNGKQILATSEAIPAGESIAVADVSGVVVGENEVLVEADPPLEDANRAHAVRVRVLRDGSPIAEETSWSEPGTRLVARMQLNVPEAPRAVEVAHE
jgi:hypothetical protein